MRCRLLAAPVTASNGSKLKKGKIMARKVEFDSAGFQFAHGRLPRGRGGWLFHPDFDVDPLDKSIISAQGTFAEAKREAARIAQERGWFRLAVLS